LIICPACGSKVDGDLCLGCASCGARSIGPPLAKAEHQLRSYGRAAIVSANGAVLLAGFLSLVIVTLFQFKGFPLRLSSLISVGELQSLLSAGEVVAWRLKWVALPITIATLWGGARMLRSIKQNPQQFMGLRPARAGLAAAIVAMLLVATLIGITVPERLRRHQWAVDAGFYAQAYTIQRALLEYRALHGTLPTNDDLVKDLSSLPDPNGAIAEALRNIDPLGYQAGSVLAAASTKTKALVPRGTVLRNAALRTNADPTGVSFTNYDLRLPGPDKVLNTEDDFIVHDGVVMKLSELPPSPSASTKPSVR
jgi:type II secretory pathway pseudopilin PulG